MDVTTADKICTLSEKIALHLSEVLEAISKLPPLLQNTYAVTSAEILLDLQGKRIAESHALPSLWPVSPTVFQ